MSMRKHANPSQPSLSGDDLSKENNDHDDILEKNTKSLSDITLSKDKSDLGKRSESKTIESLKEKLEEFKESFDKITYVLQLMKEKLAEKTPGGFKEFWDAKTVCLNLFKESSFFPKKTSLWIEYQELSQEAKRLKEELEEQVAFTVEQIDIAVKALKEELEKGDPVLANIEDIPFPITSKIFTKKFTFYNETQQQLNLLTCRISRVNTLRKEILKTDMRYHQKHMFFDRLSKIGDLVFPKRKDLICKISEQFIEDIDEFINTHFSDKKTDFPYYALREEIKGLQSLAKTLNLNTRSFSLTREKLSDCWNKIKVLEKEFKKERDKKRGIFKANQQLVQEKIAKVAPDFDQSAIDDMRKHFNEITQYMRTIELGKKEVNSLKEELNQLKEPLLKKEQELKNEKNRLIQDKKNRQNFKIQEVRDKIKKLSDDSNSLDFEKIDEEIQLLTKLIEEKFPENEKACLLHDFKKIKINILTSTASDLLQKDSSEESLKAMLIFCRQQKKIIKEQVQIYRKAMGGSNLDIEKSLTYNGLMQEGKSDLEKIENCITQINNKLSAVNK